MVLSSKTRENTLCEFSLVIATVAKVSRKRGLWLVVRVIYCFTEVDCRDIFFSTKKSTSQINSKKCSCCHAYQSLTQWINFDFILKPVSFHLKFVMLHNDSLLSQILLSNCCQLWSDIMVLEILYLILVQLCTSRDSVIYHQKVQSFMTVFLMYCWDQHTLRSI